MDSEGDGCGKGHWGNQIQSIPPDSELPNISSTGLASRGDIPDTRTA